jgi:hypothetical protein
MGLAAESPHKPLAPHSPWHLNSLTRFCIISVLTNRAQDIEQVRPPKSSKAPIQHEIVTTASVSATPDRVWSVLLDFPPYAEWNPFVRSIKGVASEGSRLTVVLSPPGGKPMTFRPVVLSHSAPTEFRWRGKLFFPGPVRWRALLPLGIHE